MVGQGQMMEAFEKFYAENVVMEEPMSGKTVGKDANRKREEDWVEMVAEAHGGGIKSMASDEENGVTMTESWADFTFKDGNRAMMEEVSVKKWEGDQIVHERFYYNMPSQQ